jgi:ureidoacrylate peracid hydrolase
MANTALLVIDAQKIYTEKDGALACKDASRTLEKINKLISRFAEKNLPVIYIRHQHKKDGSDTGRLFDYEAEGEGEEEFNFVEGTDEVKYAPKLKLVERRHEIIKNRYSAFANNKLGQLLKKLKVNRVVICGFMTNFCCESTARDALDLDYYVDFIVDATGTPGTDEYNEVKVRSVVAELLGAGFARIFKTSDYLKESV